MSNERRKFLKNVSLMMAGVLTVRLPVLGSVLQPPLAQPDASWIRSLYERGNVTTYLKSKNELQYIGMPVGGIMCGTVYLGGDGRLWLWDIFNKNQEGIEPKVVNYNANVLDGGKKVRSRDGACYIEPSKNIRPLDQGFALQLQWGNKTVVRNFDEASWPEISFEATYPIATIRYIDPALPVTVTLEAFSPFIPLNADDSGLPVTILSYQVHNTGNVPVTATILGWLENKTAIYSAGEAQERVNTVVKGKGWQGIHETVRTRTGSHEEFSKKSDYGSFCIAAAGNKVIVNPAMRQGDISFTASSAREAIKPVNQKLNGSVATQHTVLPGKTILTD